MAFVRGKGYYLRSEFPKLTMETLVLWGQNDKFVNPKLAPNYEEIYQAVPGCVA